MNSAPCLQLFARLPVPGKVKTRLIPVLGAEGACALHEQLLADRLALLRDCEQELGVTSLQLLPVHAITQDERLHRMGLRNY